MCIVWGSLSLTATGLMIFWMGNRPMNLGANFLDSTLRGKFLRGKPYPLYHLVWRGLGAVLVGRFGIAIGGVLQRLAGLCPSVTAALNEGLH